jgi:hypothetical protein
MRSYEDGELTPGPTVDVLYSEPTHLNFFLPALRIRTMLHGEQDESVATVLQYMGTLEFRSEQYDRAFQLLNEYVRIREEIGAENDGDYVNVMIMVGNIHKIRHNEDEAKRCWTAAYKVFQELGMAENNPQIAEVMNSLVKDPNAKPESAKQGGMDDSGVDSKSKSVLSRISEKAKQGIALANKQMSGARGQQL